MIRPTVAVVITAFRRESFWREAVQSALAQTEPPEEIIVVKTAGPDDTFPNSRVNILVVSEELTIGSMYAAAYFNSHSEVIALLDDDDKFLAGKVEAVKNVFLDSQILMHRNESYVVGKDGFGHVAHRTDSMLKVSKTIDPYALTAMTDWKYVFNRSFLRCSTMTVRREVMERYVRLLPQLVGGTDWFFTFAALSCGRVFYDARPYLLYRVHPNNTWGADNVSRRIHEIQRAYQCMKTLLPNFEHGSPLMTVIARDYRAEARVTTAVWLKHKLTLRDWWEYGAFIRRYFRPYRVLFAMKTIARIVTGGGER
jgi:glycosyltransferase involved in cell wall biosynthesis